MKQEDFNVTNIRNLTVQNLNTEYLTHIILAIELYAKAGETSMDLGEGFYNRFSVSEEERNYLEKRMGGVMLFLAQQGFKTGYYYEDPEDTEAVTPFVGWEL